jgi:hypothetical protein
MLGPPSPPTPGTDHLSAPSGVSEYSLPDEPTTATLPSGATAGGWRMYWPSTSKRHLTSPRAAGDGGASAIEVRSPAVSVRSARNPVMNPYGPNTPTDVTRFGRY